MPGGSVRLISLILASAAAGELLHGLREGLVGTLEFAETLLASFVAISIQHDEAGDRARGNPNIDTGGEFVSAYT